MEAKLSTRTKPTNLWMTGMFVGWLMCGFLPTWTFAKPPEQRPEPPANEMILIARYMAEVHEKIQRFWDVKGISLMDLHRRHAVLQLWIDPRGQVIKFRITHSSGLAAMDRSLIAAVRKAHPFVAPPKPIVSLLKTDGLEITIKRRVFLKKLLPTKPHYRGTAVVPNWTPRVEEKTVKDRKK